MFREFIYNSMRIYHVPKFQNNPSSGYGDLDWTKFGRKEEEMEKIQLVSPLCLGD